METRKEEINSTETRYVITITRDFGSLGRPIAKRLSELLHINYYDRDIVEAASHIMDLPVSVISNEEEKSGSFFKMLFPLGTESVDRQDKIFKAQQKIISDLAAKESCIIVGRCSDYILQKEQNAMHVYIYAPYEDRFKNCVGPLGMRPEVAKRMITDVDKARRSYHKQYANYEVDDPYHKDIIVNSASFGVEGTANLLAEAIRIKLRME